MALASGARTQLRYKSEASYGTVNTTGGATNLRRTDDSLIFRTQTQVSQEIRSDRMTTDLVLVGASAEGGVNIELSYVEYDTLLEALLQGTWNVYGTNGVGAAITTGNFTSQTAFTGTGMPVTNLSKGQWVRLKTTVDGGSNDGRILQISRTAAAPTATAITFETPSPSVTTGAMPSFSFQTSRLINGTTQRSFSLEREHSDITQFVMFRGMVPSKLSMNFQSGAIVTGSMDFMGKDQLSPTGTTGFTGGAASASKTYDVMNAVTGVGNILENGTILTGTYIKSLSLDIDNALRGRDAIGNLGNVEIASGTLSVTGRMSVYFANATLYNKFIGSTATSLSFSAQDASGNGYMFYLPKVKFSEGNIVSGNKDSDSMVDMGFTALMDTSTGTNYMIAVDRVGVAVA
jgi:hypothetical protein